MQAVISASTQSNPAQVAMEQPRPSENELDSLRDYEVGTLNRTLEATKAQLEIERHAQQRDSESRYRAFENPNLSLGS